MSSFAIASLKELSYSEAALRGESRTRSLKIKQLVVGTWQLAKPEPLNRDIWPSVHLVIGKAEPTAEGGCATWVSLKPAPIWGEVGWYGIPREGRYRVIR
jgi:hypothetical protein